MDTYTPLDTSIIFEVPVLLDSTGIPPVVHLSQYDRSIPVLALKLSSSTGKDWSIPEGATGNVQMYKPDKTGVYTPVLGCSEDKKTVYVPVVKQMTAAAGIGRMAVEILTDDDAIHTGVVVLDIAANPIPEGAYESSDDYKTLKEIIDEVQGAAETATSSASAAQASATAAASSQQAAKASEDAAKKSETAANSSASSANESASNAEESASAAEKSKTEAGSSAAAAKESQDAAKQSQDAAKQSADTASAGAQLVTDNKAALDVVADNVEAIQNAASNAQKAQESADAAASDAAKAEAAAKNAQAIAQGQKGYFEDPDALQKAVPTGEDGDWAIVGTTDTIWIWDADTGKWTNSGQNIDMSNYYTKTEAQTKLSGAAGQAVGFDADGNAQAVEVGGRNLILNSNTPQTGTYAIGIYTLSEALHTGDAISVKAKLTLAEGRNQVVISSSGGLGTYYLTDNKDGTYQGVFPSLPAAYENTKQIEIYALPNNGDNGGGITEIKLERGLVATDWTPAPEDIQAELDGKQDKLTLPLSPAQGGTGRSSSTGSYYFGIDDINVFTRVYPVNNKDDSEFYGFNFVKSTGDLTLREKNAKIGNLNAIVYTSSHKPTPADIGAQATLTGTVGQVVGFNSSGAAQAVEVGGRNLLLNSGITKTGSFNVTNWKMAEPGIIDEKYTFSALIEAPEGVEYVDLYRNEGSGDLLLKFPVTPNQKQKVVFTFTNTYNSYAELVRPALVAKPDTLIPLTAYWAKLEHGSVATDWTPAPEDIQTELDGKQNKLTGTAGQAVGFDASGAAQAVEVGGRNLFILCNSVSGYLNDNNDGTILPPSSSSINERTSDYIQVEKGEILTIQTWATALSGIVYGRYMFDYQWFKEKSPESHIGNKTRFAGGELGFNHAIGITNPAPDEAKYIRVDARFYSDGKIKVERGSIATDWTPAPEDLQLSLFNSSGEVQLSADELQKLAAALKQYLG